MALILIGAAIIPAIITSAQSAPPTTTAYSYGGAVNLQLPPGGGALADRPTTLLIDFWYTYSGQGVFYGPADVLRVFLWVPSSNAFVPVAIIQNNPNASMVPWLQSVVNGTPIEQNIFTVDPSQLQVNRTGFGVLLANLTVSENITVGDPFPSALKALNFTLPPLALEVRGFNSGFTDQVAQTLPSGWNVTVITTAQPAWARVWIPQWLGATYFMADGTLNQRTVSTYNSP